MSPRKQASSRTERSVTPWSALQKRIRGPEAESEWCMPLAEIGDDEAIVAWVLFASRVGVRVQICDLNEDELEVVWDTPIVENMQQSLAMAEQLNLKEMGKVARRRLGRVIRDLQTYRDIGCSSRSPKHPGHRPVAARKQA